MTQYWYCEKHGDVVGMVFSEGLPLSMIDALKLETHRREAKCLAPITVVECQP